MKRLLLDQEDLSRIENFISIGQPYLVEPDIIELSVNKYSRNETQPQKSIVRILYLAT